MRRRLAIPNIGRLDQFIRILLSLSMIYLGFIDAQLIPDPISRFVLGAFGVINLVVALVRFCPLYALTGIRTCATRRD